MLIHGKQFLCCFPVATVGLRRAIVAVLTEQSRHNTFENFTTVITVNEDWVFQELGTEQVLQVLRLSLCVFMFSDRKLRIWPCSFRFSEIGMSSIGCGMVHRSFRPCWCMLPDVLRVWWRFLSLKCHPYRVCGPNLLSFVLSCELFDQKEGCQCLYSTCRWYHECSCRSDGAQGFLSGYKSSWCRVTASPEDSLLVDRPWAVTIKAAWILCTWLWPVPARHFFWGHYKSYTMWTKSGLHCFYLFLRGWWRLSLPDRYILPLFVYPHIFRYSV